MTALEDAVPVVQFTGYGRAQRFVEELRQTPGDWKKYPHPINAIAAAISKNRHRYPGTEWAVDTDGELCARWIGD